MGVRAATRSDLNQEIARVIRHIDQAMFDLAQAKCRLGTGEIEVGSRSVDPRGERELATLCTALELALADSVVGAQRLADKLPRGHRR